MNLIETTKLIIWVNQFDPYVQANDAARDIWAHSMKPLKYNEAEEAIVQHYRANPGVKAEPGAILKRALQIRSSREAIDSATAIEAPMPVKHPLSWRKRNPELWDRLFEEGRRQGNEERRLATEARQRAESEENHDDWMAA